MSQSWPPNPRSAKHRQPVVFGHGALITIALAIVCAITAYLSHLGKDNERVGWMYFQSQAQRDALVTQYEVLYQEWSKIAEVDSPANDEKLEQLSRQLSAIEVRLKTLGSGRDKFADIKAGQVWRLVTPIFLHFGLMHLVFNLYWLWSLGAVLESRYRWLRYGLMIIGIAVLSNVAQALFAGTNFGGMSGVNYGLFGFLFIHGRYHPTPHFRLEGQTVFIMFVWLVICFTGVAGPVANWAHLFGFLAGAGISFTDAMMAGGAKNLRRRGEFKRAIASAKNSALHQCKVCGCTEVDQPNREFRVDADGEEYCEKHLPGEL